MPPNNDKSDAVLILPEKSDYNKITKALSVEGYSINECSKRPFTVNHTLSKIAHQLMPLIFANNI